MQYHFQDRLISPRVKENIRNKAKMIAAIRSYLDSLGYIEVDTPILYPYPEIAPMEQFKVVDPTTGSTYYLRVCPTEHLKRFMVAGFEKVYEFSRNFRPGNSFGNNHSSEFTSLECSQIGCDYKDMMRLTESIVEIGIRSVKNESIVNVAGKLFDVTPPWNRVTVRDALIKYADIDILSFNSVPELNESIGHEESKDREKFDSFDQIIDYLLE